MLNINFDPSGNDPVVISFKTMRRMAGLLGMALPVAACLWSVVCSDSHTLLESISAYYHTNMRDIVVGILCAVSFFLFAYHGYDTQDFITFKIAGISALGIALFPALIENTNSSISLALNASPTTDTLHIISASIFFITLAYISLCLFTKSKPNTPKQDRSGQKIIRNRIYILCGSVIVLCLVLLFVVHIPSIASSVKELNPVFWLEAIALLAFGISWLVKGETLFKDA